MKIKERILSGLCAISLAFGMSRTKSDAKIISYVADSILGSFLNIGNLAVIDCLSLEQLKNFKEQKVSNSLLVIINILGLMDFVNRIIDTKYVQDLEAELQKLKEPDKKPNEQKKTDDKKEKLNNSTNGKKKG